jgi:hypothetical protein
MNNSGIQIMSRALEFLSNIKEPIPATEFVNLELTGDTIADKQLVALSLATLNLLKGNGLVDSDDPYTSGAKIRGLTTQGTEMLRLFNQLITSRKS